MNIMQEIPRRITVQVILKEPIGTRNYWYHVGSEALAVDIIRNAFKKHPAAMFGIIGGGDAKRVVERGEVI